MAAQIRVSGVRSIRNLALVSLAAGVPRVIGALFFGKEAFGDAYCYIEQVSAMRGKMVAGTFSVASGCANSFMALTMLITSAGTADAT